MSLRVRTDDHGGKRLAHDANLDVFDMRCIDEMGTRHALALALALALATIDAHAHLHVSIDVDVPGAAVAPGVGTTVRGRPTYREAELRMETIADTGRRASLDIFELNPAIDVRDATALLAVDPVECLLGKSTLMHGRSASGAPASPHGDRGVRPCGRRCVQLGAPLIQVGAPSMRSGPRPHGLAPTQGIACATLLPP